MNEIIVGYGVHGKLQKIFTKSRPTIRMALRGKSSSILAMKIRKAALENGGREIKAEN